MPKELLKVVLDTTILVSAFLTPGGLSREILRLASLHLFEFLSSEEILEETRLSLLFKNHIRPKYPYTDAQVEEFIVALRESCMMVTDIHPLSVVKQDPKDDKILACALAQKAHDIISRDVHLLDLKEYQGIKILKPEDFIWFLRNQ
ncbi:putative toxin-antitoxin system toxin component, PIN family [Candidatus Poribacteria bacterium]|nr:putative toxin-antitoxin system toxin component, PIN family [Candidatus Poribacteria bacterium]